MIASISAVDEPVSTGDPRWSNIAFNDGTSMIDDLSIFEMDHINITKKCCNIVRTIQKNWMTLNCLINQDPQSNKWIFHAEDLKGSKIRIRTFVWLDFFSSGLQRISSILCKLTITSRLRTGPESIFITPPNC